MKMKKKRKLDFFNLALLLLLFPTFIWGQNVKISGSVKDADLNKEQRMGGWVT